VAKQGSIIRRLARKIEISPIITPGEAEKVEEAHIKQIRINQDNKDVMP
jgi:hypothetical protein